MALLNFLNIRAKGSHHDSGHPPHITRFLGMTDASEWRGPVGDVWAREWRRTDRSFGALAGELVAAIVDHAPRGPITAVDIGCGSGPTSLAFATARPDARVIGIDMSPALVAVARERGAGLPNLEFVAGPAEIEMATRAPVDLAFSRHGVMFFPDPVVAFTAIRGTMAPDAPLVFSCFRAATLNPWAAEIAVAIRGAPMPVPAGYAPGPFAFADADFVTGLLERSGWHDVRRTPVDYVNIAGQGDDPVADALAFFERIGPAAPALRAAAPPERAAMRERIVAVLERHVIDGAVAFPAAAWLWSAKAPA